MFKTLGTAHLVTLHHIPEGLNIQQQNCDNLRSHRIAFNQSVLLHVCVCVCVCVRARARARACVRVCTYRYLNWEMMGECYRKNKLNENQTNFYVQILCIVCVCCV